VRGSQVDFPRSSLVHQASGTADRATGTDHIIEEQAYLPFDRPSDDISLLGLQGSFAHLVDDRQFASYPFRVTDRSLDAPLIGTYDHNIIGIVGLILKILC
jgi:hypothetical protein